LIGKTTPPPASNLDDLSVSMRSRDIAELKYFIDINTEKNEIKKEIAARINTGNRSFYELEKLLRSIDLKIQLYMIFLHLIITYEAES